MEGLLEAEDNQFRGAENWDSAVGGRPGQVVQPVVDTKRWARDEVVQQEHCEAERVALDEVVDETDYEVGDEEEDENAGDEVVAHELACWVVDGLGRTVVVPHLCMALDTE